MSQIADSDVFSCSPILILSTQTQSRPVHVYYPVAIHPQKEFPTFDEKLDELLKRRKQLAADFLAPMPTEDELQRELLNSLGVTHESTPVEQILTIDDLKDLTWDRFESFVALLEGKYGRAVWLSPKSGDGGIDVVTQLGSEVRLLQCKHSQWTTAVDREVIEELIASSDAFRSSLRVAGFTFKPVLVTNSSVSKSVKEFGFKRDIEVIGIDSFMSYIGQIKCTRAEVESMEQLRYRGETFIDFTEIFEPVCGDQDRFNRRTEPNMIVVGVD
jgi:hypothetical protein